METNNNKSVITLADLKKGDRVRVRVCHARMDLYETVTVARVGKKSATDTRGKKWRPSLNHLSRDDSYNPRFMEYVL